MKTGLGDGLNSSSILRMKLQITMQDNEPMKQMKQMGVPMQEVLESAILPILAATAMIAEDQVAAGSVEPSIQVEDQVAAVAALDVEPSNYLAHPCLASSPPPPHQARANFGSAQRLRRLFVAADPLGRSSSIVSSTIGVPAI